MDGSRSISGTVVWTVVGMVGRMVTVATWGASIWAAVRSVIANAVANDLR